jgi:hypothetical protein
MSECGIPYLQCTGIGLAVIVFSVAVWAWLIWITMHT